jgi:hypothetical protein
MDSWTALTWGMVAGAGTMLFLKVVSVRIAFGEGTLNRLEAREKGLLKNRLRAIRDAQVIEAELADKSSAA